MGCIPHWLGSSHCTTVPQGYWAAPGPGEQLAFGRPMLCPQLLIRLQPLESCLPGQAKVVVVPSKVKRFLDLYAGASHFFREPRGPSESLPEPWTGVIFPLARAFPVTPNALKRTERNAAVGRARKSSIFLKLSSTLETAAAILCHSLGLLLELLGSGSASSCRRGISHCQRSPQVHAH